ncbi:glutathione S-transferase family protein [Paraburkholderia sp. BCC1886]|uniref:glutathione S-transferase family protein n=1 Tax=Paraburkholderia sp. BCC1886 TaxID=2562670 RepID=UPI001181FF34|nr:glutathione S-transferase N-terminal domain-containing protein [Paraburkholderia sp. BCC1886]
MTEQLQLTFYTADTPNGQKISIFLEEAALSHKKVNLNLSAGDQHTADYLAINPNGKIPAIVDHAADITVFESGAILSYLSSTYGHLHPADPKDRIAVQQWLHFQIGGIGPMLGQLWWFLHASKTVNTEAINRYTNEALRLYGVVDRRLASSPFIATSLYSIADIAAFTWLRTHEELNLDIQKYRHVTLWLEQIGDRPAVKRALESLRVLVSGL